MNSMAELLHIGNSVTKFVHLYNLTTVQFCVILGFGNL